ncbi:PAS domain-containing protein [Photorhabdus sp. APURE]|uniref:PAS domain-containing protein n=1 Tax=Photorhabdus aballayi TaxID=2991723 RepID=UPI00223E2951|nr:PAS domain-containing protein [Photorhabdus aballayi]MCW7547757.1 PAS domain-containing protein [Photorhabdus aballayi]
MLNIRNKPSHITPQLTLMWDKSNEPWEARARQSRFIYANPASYQLHNLPEDFDIIELSMGELPSPIGEHAEEFDHQDQKAIQTMQRATSLETHKFSEHKVKQTYICDKFLLCEDVVNHIQSIYQKFNLSPQIELSDFCKKNNCHLYIPERFLTIGSREL